MLKQYIDYNNEKSLVFKLRQRRSRYIKALIKACYHEFGEVKIIDIGGTIYYWKIISREFLAEHRVHITLVNLGPNRVKNPDPELFTLATGDGCHMPEYADKSFHLAHSNSVIEHVGGGDRLRQFASETKRVSHYYYLQTPNYWFPIDPHFLNIGFHWLPRKWQIWMLMRFNLGWASRRREYAVAAALIDENTLIRPRKVRQLFPDGKIHYEWFGPLIKSIIVQSSNR